MSSSSLELHVIEREGDSIVLHPPTYTIFTVEKVAGKVLEAYASGRSPEAISKMLNIPFPAIRQLIESIHGCIDGLQPVSLASKADEQKEALQKLELMVSNDCNLNCLYCYAQGGDYGRKKSLMPVETGVAAVDRMFEHFRAIDSIVFFGGEPLMNLPVIEAVCESLQRKLERGVISALPTLGIITNGTLITGRAADLIKKFNIHVTVSVDGPPGINDTLRPFKSGKGSYEGIKRGLNNLRDRKVDPNFEFTYTQAHVDQGITPIDVLEHLHEALGFPEGFGSIGEADLPETDPLNVADTVTNFHEPLLDWMVQKFIDGKLISGDITLTIALQIIFKQARIHICPAGYKSLAIATNGNIFPCHILTDRDAFVMGNIADPKWHESTGAADVYRMLEAARKEENPHCSKCWARYMCAGCLGGWEPEGPGRLFINEAKCQVKRKIWDATLIKIMELKENEEAWNRLEKMLQHVLKGWRTGHPAGTDINNSLPLVQIQNAAKSSSATQQAAR
jgi:uncharacterized protein